MSLESLLGDDANVIPLKDLAIAARDLLQLDFSGYTDKDPRTQYVKDCFINEVAHLIDVASKLEELYSK